MFVARWLWLVVVALLAATRCAASVELTNGTVYECRSGDESITLFSLPIGAGQAPEDLLLVVEVFFLAGSNRSGDELAVTVTTDDNSLVGTLTASAANNSGAGWAAASMFCWGPELSFLLPRSYLLSVAHLPYAQFGLAATLLVRRLAANQPSVESLPISSVWWYFDMTADPAAAPLQFDFTSRSGHGHVRIASVFYGCPGPLSPSTLLPADRPGVVETFNERARVTVSKKYPPLAQGRWFVNVIKSRTDVVDIAADFGTPYDHYPAIWGWTAGVLLLLCPAICAVTLLLVWWTQQHHQLDTNAINDQYNSDDDDDDDDEEKEDSNGDDGGRRRQTLPTHFWELTSIVGMVFFVPAVQIQLSELHEQSVSGYRDLCYYNDLCEKPTLTSGVLMYAFNNVYSNVGYLVAGLTAVGYLTLLRYRLSHWRCFMPVNYGSLAALCICLVFVGLNSAAYHLCPSRQSFQVDSAMQAGFALLCIGDVWRRYFYPHLHAWIVFAVLALLLFLNYVGTILDVFPPVASRLAPKLFFRLTLTLLIAAAATAWLVFIWRLDRRRPRRAYTVVLGLVVAPTLALLWWNVHTDMSQTFLAICIVLFAVAIMLDFAARVGLGTLVETCRLPPACLSPCPTRHRRCCATPASMQSAREAVLFLFLFLCWSVSGVMALYYFALVGDTNKDLTPAQSRNLARPCIVADYYSAHDMWHFLSAISLLCSILIIGHLFHGKGASTATPPRIIADSNSDDNTDTTLLLRRTHSSDYGSKLN